MSLLLSAFASGGAQTATQCAAAAAAYTEAAPQAPSPQPLALQGPADKPARVSGTTDASSTSPAQSTPVSAASGPISLDEAIRRAETNEPAFAAAAAQQRVTVLQRTDARAALLPSALIHSQYLFTQSDHTAAVTAQGGIANPLPIFIANNAVHEYVGQASVNQTFGLAGIAALKLADANAAVAAAEYEVARRGLVQTVVSLYFGRTAADAKLSVAQRALDEAKHFVTITTDREQAREAAHSDVIKAQLGQQQRERELEDAQLAATKAQLELGVLLFPNPAATYTLAKNDAPPLLPNLAAVEARASANNPEIRSATASLRVSQAESLTAQSALLPDLALNFTYGIDAPQLARRGPDGARNLGYSASATVDLPLWDWLTTERKVKEAHIQQRAAQTALTAAQRRALANLQELYNEAQVAYRQLASLDRTVVDARESLRLANLRYVNGETQVLDVVDAENTLILAEDAQADGYVRYRVALAELETLTGRL